MDPILEDVIVTTANDEGEIIGRHIVSKANTLWRQYRLGGTYKDEEEKEIFIYHERSAINTLSKELVDYRKTKPKKIFKEK